MNVDYHWVQCRVVDEMKEAQDSVHRNRYKVHIIAHLNNEQDEWVYGDEEYISLKHPLEIDEES